MNTNSRSRKLMPLIVILFWFAQYVYIPYQTPFLNAIGVSAGTVGVIVGAYGISQMVMRLPVGLMADHVGKHKRFIIMGGLFAGIGSLFRVVMPNAAGFLVANLFSGLASAMWISFMVCYTGFYAADKQQEGFSRIILYNNAGILIAFAFATVVYERTSMQLLCACSAAAGLLAAALACCMDNDQPTGKRPGIRELLPICLNKRLIFFALLALVQQGVQMATTMSFTNQVLKGLGATDAIVGMASIVFMISSVTCAALAGTQFIIRLGVKRLVPFGFAAVLAYCLLVPVVGSVPAVVALQALPGISTGLLLSALTSQAMVEVPKHQKSTANGFYQAVYSIGMTAMPVFTGNIAAASGMTSAYFVLGGITALAIVVSIVGMRRMK